MKPRFSARALAFAFAFFCLANGYGSPVDSLNQVIKTSKADSIRASANQLPGMAYTRINLDSARVYLREGARLYERIGQEQKAADSFNSVGISFAMQGNQDSAIFHVEQSLSIHSRFNDSLKMAFAFNNLGLMNIDRNEYELGVKNLLQAHDIKRNLIANFRPEHLDMGSTELNIGIAFHFMEDLAKALQYYNLARGNYKQQSNELGVARASFQIGNVFRDTDDLLKADSVYQMLFNARIFERDSFLFAKLLNNFSDVLIALEQFYRAREMSERAHEINRKMGSTRALGLTLVRLGEIEFHLKNYRKAVGRGLEAYSTAKENKLTMVERQAASILAAAYKELGNYKLALEYSLIDKQLSDSIYNFEKTSIVAEMEAKYQAAQKEKKIFEQEVVLTRMKKSRQLFVLFSVFALVFAGYIYHNYRQNHKRNIELQRVINTKNKLISIIAHDLKNPAIAQKIAIEQLLLNVDRLKDKALFDNISALHKSSDSQVSLLLNLLNWAHTQSGTLKPNPITFNLNEVVEKNLELFVTSALNKDIEIHFQAEEVFNVTADKDMINTVIRNLLSNALKFSNKGQPIYITLGSKDGSKISCKIKDLGIGMDSSKLEGLFNLDKRELCKGTSGEEGSGLGLFLCREMILANGGQIQISSNKNMGPR